MTVAQIAQSPEWKEKQAADALLLRQMQEQLNASNLEKAALLDGTVPVQTDINGRSIFLTAEDKMLIVMYAFIGLSELVSVSSNQPMAAIWKACVERAIRNLKQEGLLQ